MPAIQPYLQHKLYRLEDLVNQVQLWREQGKTIGFTNGVFDILHTGHVNYLTEAASHVDHLILGLNSDASVKRLGKGDDRPINDEQSRAIVLAGLHAISAVCTFSDDTPLAQIATLVPDVLMKGGDYDVSIDDPKDSAYIVGSREVKAAGGRVLSIPFVEGYSTTSLLDRVQRNPK